MYGKAARAPAPRPSTPGLRAATQRGRRGEAGWGGGRGGSAVQPRPHLAAAASAEGPDRPGGAQRGGPRSRGAVHPSLPRPAGAGGRALEGWKVEETTDSRTGQETRAEPGLSGVQVFSKLPPGSGAELRARGDRGGCGWAPAVKLFPGKDWESKSAAAAAGGRGAGWGRQKLDRLGSLELRRERKGRGLLRAGAAETPSALLSKEVAQHPRLASPAGATAGRAGELTYFGAEAALGRAEGGERGGESEQGEQQTAGGPWGRRHGPRPSRQPAVRAPRRGPKPWGRAATPLGRLCLRWALNLDSSSAVRLEMRGLLLKAPVCSSPLPRFLIFLLLSLRTASRALSHSSGPSLLLSYSLFAPAPMPSFPVRTWLFQPESNYSQEPGKKNP